MVSRNDRGGRRLRATKIQAAGLAFAALLGWTALAAAERIEVDPAAPAGGLTLTAQSAGGVELRFRMGAFELQPLEIEGEILQAVRLPGALLPNDAGAPDLPGLSRLIAIPEGATASVTIVAAEERVYEEIAIAPAPVLPRENEDGPLRYRRDPILFGRDADYPDSPTRLSEIRGLRGVDVVALGLTPFQYNPVARRLTVYTDVTLRVDFHGGAGRFGEERLRSRHWEPILARQLINYASLPPHDTAETAADRSRYGWEYVIVCPDDPAFTAWADTLKSWRTLQGISTEVFTTAEIGSTWQDVRNFLHGAFYGWETPPAAFLILGDTPDSGDRTPGVISPVWDGYCVSDNIYADVDGDDLPDMVAARICARNASELGTTIGKMLDYERAPYTDAGFYNHPIIAGGWQTERWFILCTEVCLGHQANALGKEPVREYAIYAGQPGEVWSTAPNTEIVVDTFGPNGLGYVPATPQHLLDWGGNATRINNDINAGAYLLLHRDHGYQGGWGEPSYGIGNLGGLTNEMYPFVFTINCLTGKYNAPTPCFAEAFHRMEHGALGLVAPSEVSYSFVNDTFVWGMFDCLWPGFMPDYPGPCGDAVGPSDLRTAFAMTAGKHFLAQSSWPYNQDNKAVTLHLFHHHGDAFMTLNTEPPTALSVWHHEALPLGAAGFALRADEGALIGLTIDGELVGSAVAGGATQIVPLAPQWEAGTLRITITKANHYRYDETVPIGGTLFVVRPDGSGDHPTIQAAVDAAAPGVVIELTDGLFTGPGNRDVDLHGRAVTIRSQSADPAACVIDCGGTPAEPHRAFLFLNGESSTTRLEDLTLRHGHAGSGDGGALLCTGASPAIRRCLLIANQAARGGGAAALLGADPTFSGCVFTGNAADDGSALVVEGARSVIEHCTLYDNLAQAPGGGTLATGSGSELELDRAILAANTGAAVSDNGATAVTLACCDLYGNSGGDWIGSIGGQYGVDGNIAADPLFCDALGGDFGLHSLSPCAPEADPACGLIGARPVACWPAVMQIKPDGTGDHPTIQAAIDAALFGDVIELTSGLFTGPGNRDLDFGGRSITLRSRSGDAAACVIDCQGSPSDPHRGFTFTSGEGELTVIENVTVTGGYSGDDGGAILCEGASPTLVGLILRGNEAAGLGGALDCAAGSPTLHACTFAGNAAENGGALACSGGAPLVTGCTLVDNLGHSGAGGLFCGAGSMVAIDRTIIAFSAEGPAVACASPGLAQLACCDLYGNAGGDWVGEIAGQYGVDGNIAADPRFCDRPYGDYGLTQGSPCSAEEHPTCDLIGAWPVSCLEPFVVLPDGSGDYPTIQAAIDAAADGIIIRLGDGTFAGPGNRDLDFLGRRLIVTSLAGRPDSCIIDCEGSAAEPHRGFRFHSGEDEQSVVQGLTIRGGYQTYGGAIHIQGAEPLIRNCILTDNIATNHGGGIYIYYHSAARIENCTLVANSAPIGAGVSAHSYSVADLANTIVAYNMVGDAVHCYFNSEAVLACCDLYGNTGGDYVSCAASWLGVDGNICADPAFCDTPAGDYRLWNTSPCAPANSPGNCALIGAMEVGCEDVTAAPAGDPPAVRRLLLAIQSPATARGATIHCALPGSRATRVTLRIYDAGGRLVRTLIDETRPPGLVQVVWDGRAEGGTQAGSGVYFCRLTAGDESRTRSLTVIR